MAMDFKARIRALRESLERHRVDSMLVTHMPNVRYLCGFTGSSGALLVGPNSAALYTDGRYTLQAKAEISGARVRTAKGGPQVAALSTLSGRKAKVAVEAEHLTLAQRNV